MSSIQGQGIGEKEQSTPMSARTSKKNLHLQKLKGLMFPIESCKAFVLGLSGGDCAGKREIIQFMFERRGEEWIIRETQEPVAILHQEYFVKESNGKQFMSEGTDWQRFYFSALHLMVGNEVKISYYKEGKTHSVTIKPAKLLVIEGQHVFMDCDANKHLNSLLNLRVFIDSDSDVRLSRRIFRDTQDYHISLNDSITNYLQFIKPSYEKEIQPTKKESDIIIPHFGGGFDDHHKENKIDYSSTIKNACNLILTHLKEEMKKYEEEIDEKEKTDTV